MISPVDDLRSKWGWKFWIISSLESRFYHGACWRLSWFKAFFMENYPPSYVALDELDPLVVIHLIVA
jgi:hypothetical protein